MSLRHVVLTILPISMIACGGATLPPAQTSDSTAAIRAAEELGADQYPQGALYMKRARDEMKLAESLAEDGDQTAATRALIRAEMDADVALAVAQMNQSRRQAQQATNAVYRLRTNPAQP